MSAALLLAHDEPWDHGPMRGSHKPVDPEALIVDAMRRLGPGSHARARVLRTAGLYVYAIHSQRALCNLVTAGALQYDGRLICDPLLPRRDRCATIVGHTE